MVIFDIIIALLLIIALWRGFRRGFFVQLAGLAGLFIGAWLAVRFGKSIGLFFGVGEKYAAAAGFLIVLLVIILVMAGIGRAFKGAFSFAGLSMIDKLAGMVLSLAKTGLLLGLLLWGFDYLNRPRGWVEEPKLEQSVFYRPLVDITVFVFPYVKSVDNLLAPLYRSDETEMQTEPRAEDA